MLELLRTWMLAVLRVPEEPAPPAGSREIQLFRASPLYLRYRLLLWGMAQLAALIGLVIGLTVFYDVTQRVVISVLWDGAGFLVPAGEFLFWLGFIVQLPFSYLLVRLDFDLRWYMLSDRSLRIREGIVSITEKTMTYANVQQISVRQNPLQRLFGIADIEVRSAGGGSRRSDADGRGDSTHLASFRGVGEAEKIRDAIRERVRQHRDAGLGDPDDSPHGVDSPTDDAVPAARELLNEIRGLRRQILARS